MGTKASFDLSDENQFRAYVVANLETLGERTAGVQQIQAGFATLAEKLSDYHEVKKNVEKIAVLEDQVTEIREDMRSDKKWSRIQATVGPVMVVIHGIAHKFGIF